MSAMLATAACVSSLAANGPQPATDASLLDGVWWIERHEAHLRPIDGRPLPFTAAGRAHHQKIIAGLANGGIVDDAVHLCLAPGTPRALTSAHPMQIVITPGQVTLLFEENRFFRIVRLAGQHADPADWDPSFMGDGIARWTGNQTLVIDSTNYKANRMYLDASGVPVSSKLRLTERYRLRNNGNELEVLVTVDDPEVFTRPWTARRVFHRRDDVELKTDWVCGERRRDAPAINVATASAAAPTAGQLALNGYWENAVRPSGALAIAKVAAGIDDVPASLAAMLEKQQPWAAAERARFMAALAAGQYMPTPEMQCYPAQPPGTGRIAPNNYGLEMLVTARHVVILAEANALMRIVRMDRQHPPDLAPGWQGDSVGRWEGDTLVVDTIGFNDSNYLDRGVPFTSRMRIVERLRIVDGLLVNEATFDDPGAFTGPFTITKAYRRSAPFQEYICQENNREGGVPTATTQPTATSVPQAR